MKDSGEEDIDAILADFARKNAERTTVTILPLSEPPSPRSNYSTTVLSNDEIMLFGGEFCDGERTIVYNDVLLWNTDKNEWY